MCAPPVLNKPARKIGRQQRGKISNAANTVNERRIQLRGEMLRAVKQKVEKGEIRLRKDIVTENQTISVPVTREEVIVEQVSAGEARPLSGTIGDEGEIRIPVSEERVSVVKEPVVTGEVRVQKRVVQDNQQVSDTVRHEEVRVEKQGSVDVNDKDDRQNNGRQNKDWTQKTGSLICGLGIRKENARHTRRAFFLLRDESAPFGFRLRLGRALLSSSICLF